MEGAEERAGVTEEAQRSASETASAGAPGTSGETPSASASAMFPTGSPKSSHAEPQVIGSVPFQVWEREAFKDYHPLIRTPRGAKRLLNTYRLVRAGIPSEEWDIFRGDGATHGEFRIVMLLLASAAGYPAVAREWFKRLRNADSTALFLPDVSAETAPDEWMQFKRVYDAIFEQTTPQLTKELFAKWLDRVERFAC